MKVSRLYDAVKDKRTGQLDLYIGPHQRYVVADGNWLTNVFSKYKDKGVVVISSDTANLTEEERLSRAEELGYFIRSRGFGYRQTFGGYTYESGDKVEVEKGEYSFIVPLAPGKSEEDLYNFALEAGEKFGQESVSVWIPSYEGGKPHWVGTKPDDKNYHKPTMKFNEVSPVTTESEKETLSGWTGERKKGEAGNQSRFAYSPMAFTFKDTYNVVCYRIPCSQYQGYKNGELNKKL